MRRKPSLENRWSDFKGGSAFMIPLTMLRHPNFVRLSPCACKLLLDLARQYSGFNNGYLSAAFTILKPNGWRSEATIREAVGECLHYGFICKTRQGGRNKCNLFAFTWRRIDEKDGKPLEMSKTMRPSDEWNTEVAQYIKPSRKKLPPEAVVTYNRMGCIRNKIAPQKVPQRMTSPLAAAVIVPANRNLRPQGVTY